MNRCDRIALLLSLLAVLAGFLVHDQVFERMAHIEDEMAYLWQAQAISRGRLTLPSPPEPKSFLIPFVIDYNGQRFGKYPLGWPVLLALGERIGLMFLVNAFLGGIGVWLTYRLGKRIISETVGLIAAGLTLTSPFFLMNSGSLLSHPLGLVLSAAFALAWLDAFCEPITSHRWLATITAGASLGLLAISRPFTAVVISIPFFIHGLYLLVRGNWQTRRRLISLGLIVLAIASLYFLWQYAVTGDPFLNPYTLWWKYDKIGFGSGHGRLEQGHSLHQARINTRFSLQVGCYDLFGWGAYSWIFLPLGLIALFWKRNWRALLLASVFPSLVILYLGYWIGSSLFGPRYFYESLYSLTLVSATGIAWVAGWPIQPGKSFPNYIGWKRIRPLAMTGIIALLVATNILFYTPFRVGSMLGIYGVQRSHIEPFLSPSAQELSPALIIVHTKSKWIEYGTLIELQNPFLDTPFIFIIARTMDVNETVISHFPDRSVYYYYPAEYPYTFFTNPKPK